MSSYCHANPIIIKSGISMAFSKFDSQPGITLSSLNFNQENIRGEWDELYNIFYSIPYRRGY